MNLPKMLNMSTGTGILSMLAARAGARKVIGIDCSGILSKAQSIIDRNGLSSVITLVRGQIEQTPLPLDSEVDIIISEWMGYGLYYENMLSSVLYARDNYLTESGVMMPTTANLYLVGLGSNEATEGDRVAWWKNVYGFDMTDMEDLLTSEAQAEDASAYNSITENYLAHSLDIATATDAQLDFTVPIQLVRLMNLITLPIYNQSFIAEYQQDFRAYSICYNF